MQTQLVLLQHVHFKLILSKKRQKCSLRDIYIYNADLMTAKCQVRGAVTCAKVIHWGALTQDT